jgi:hypothetical protein
LFYLITDRDCVTLSFIDVRTLTPLKDNVAVVRPPDHNNAARGQVLFNAATALIMPLLPLPSRHPTRVAAPCVSPTRPSSSSRIPAPSGYHGCTTCRHRRPDTMYMANLTGCLRPTGGGCWRPGDTWRPQSCPAPGGGCQSPGDTWCPRSCPEPRGGSRSRGDT